MGHRRERGQHGHQHKAKQIEEEIVPNEQHLHQKGRHADDQQLLAEGLVELGFKRNAEAIDDKQGDSQQQYAEENT